MHTTHTGPPPENEEAPRCHTEGPNTTTTYCPYTTTAGPVLQAIAVQAVRVVPELYPRLQEDPAVIERYRDCLDQLPPIALARDGILVDGYHRLQAHRLEGRESIRYEDLGDLTDEEILAESIRRNATHGHQLVDADKRQLALRLWKPGAAAELAALLSVPERTLRGWTADLRGEERRQRQQQAVALWLDCLSDREIARRLEVDHKTVAAWVGEFRQSCQNSPPQDDHWRIVDEAADLDREVYTDLIRYYTEPGGIVAAPLDETGAVRAVAHEMGRRYQTGAGHVDLAILTPPERPLQTWYDAVVDWSGRLLLCGGRLASPGLDRDFLKWLEVHYPALHVGFYPVGRAETLRKTGRRDFVVLGGGDPVTASGSRYAGKIAQIASYCLSVLEADADMLRRLEDWVATMFSREWEGEEPPDCVRTMIDTWARGESIRGLVKEMM